MKPDTLLAVARKLSKPSFSRGVGTFSKVFGDKEVIITYYAPDGTYDVGTPAKQYAKGKRKDVLPALAKLMGQ